MAKKVRCPQCGAKNAADARRCRVCATIVNAEVAETARGLGLGAASLGTDAGAVQPHPGSAGGSTVPAPTVADVPVQADPTMASAAAGPTGGGGASNMEPGGVGGVGGDDSALGDPAGGIVIDVAARNPSMAPPPLDHGEEEPFDPDGLVIDPPR